MAITSSINLSPTHKNTAVGMFKDTGTVKKTAINLGFTPRYIKLIDLTNNDTYEWFEGMAADSAFKSVDAGDQSLVTSNGILAVGEIDLGSTASAWTVYNATTGSLTDTSHLNAANEKIEGFTLAVAVPVSSGQFAFVAFE
jgi:hypothetical protein